MSNFIKISISGIRGIIGHPEGLTPELIINFSQAFGTFTKGGTIVIGSDSRPTREMVRQAVTSGLLATGCHIIDLGIVPTPTVLLMVKQYKASGGIIITASHNPLEWNALKLVHAEGRFLFQSEADRLINLYNRKKFNLVKWDKILSIKNIPLKETWDSHLDKILKHINVKKIKSKKFHVAIDPVNGAGSDMTAYFLKKLGCKVSSINDRPNGLFGRGAEPTPSNLKNLSILVRKEKADIGFAQDPDADRLAVVDESGTPLGEEYTLALCIQYILQKKKGPVVLNQATSLAGEFIAEQYGQKTFRTKIGEINVTEQMIKRKAVIGGEGNGGVIYPRINTGRDSFVGIGLILDYMAQTAEPISLLKSRLPQFTMVKKKIQTDTINLTKYIAKIKKQFQKNRVSTLDGLYIRFDNSWVNIRSSNTEPIIRITAEAKDKKEANALVQRFTDDLKSKK